MPSFPSFLIFAVIDAQFLIHEFIAGYKILMSTILFSYVLNSLIHDFMAGCKLLLFYHLIFIYQLEQFYKEMLPFIYYLIHQCYHSHRKARINLHSFLLFTQFSGQQIKFLLYSDTMSSLSNIIINSWVFNPFQFYFY